MDYIVCDEHTLGYTGPDDLDFIGILVSNPFMGAMFEVLPGVKSRSQFTKIRPATRDDFTKFRMTVPPDFEEATKWIS